jgi:hypothetical protein
MVGPDDRQDERPGDGTGRAYPRNTVIASCGWLGLDEDNHGAYCERSVCSKARALTQPGWTETQICCSVISPFIRGTVPLSYKQDCEHHRRGVQASIQAHGDITIDRESEAGSSKVRFNFTPAEARQGEFIMRRLQQIADHVGADIFVDLDPPRPGR